MADNDAKLVARSCKEAKQLGLKRYTTGRPCKNGHIAERFVPSGNCSVCYKEYMEDYGAKYYQEHKDTVKARSGKRYVEKKEHILALQKADPNKKIRDKKWRLEHKDYLADYQRKWQSENREHARSVQAEWQRNNRDKVRLSIKKWGLKNPEKVKASGHNHRAKKKSAEGKYTGDDLKRIYKLQKGRCAYCNEKLNGKYQIDHIIALDNGGINWPRNLQLLCYKKRDGCNQSKGNKDPIDWVRKKLGKLL